MKGTESKLWFNKKERDKACKDCMERITIEEND